VPARGCSTCPSLLRLNEYPRCLLWGIPHNRHSYATAGRDAKIDWKALSHRIGHADVAFTMKQYVQTDLEADRQVANTLAELIIGGSLTSFEIIGTARETV